jgi:hypothetical protein
MIGIDPGAHGIIAVLSDNITYYSIPYLAGEIDFKQLASLVLELQKKGEKKVIIETPFAGAAMAKSSVLKMGVNWGKLISLFYLMEFSVVEVTPSVWKKKMNLSSDKEQSILLCQKLFPEINLRPGKKKKPDDNVAEAFLLAEYGRKYHG